MVRLLLALLLAAALLPAQKFYAYVGDVGARHALVAWGATHGRDTIGRGSPSYGKAALKIGGRDIAAEQRNWAIAEGLTPDTEYPYEVWLAGRKIAGGTLRTWPEKSRRLTFFVIGDFGNGSAAQFRVAEAMWKEFERSRDAVRFVLSAGDNIYAHKLLRTGSGKRDSDWDSKFFRPYERLLQRVPFYATLGNHDGNESESRADLAACLDNFFFPGNKPARYYRFAFADLAEFFALDTSSNSMEGSPAPGYGPASAQFHWLAGELAAARAPWKIAFFHHPPFSAGPRHKPAGSAMKDLVELLAKHGVPAAFHGHEHNFQFSERSPHTSGIRFFVSGAGGELRKGDVRKTMQRARIEGWAPQHHFLRVEIDGGTMRVEPLSWDPVAVVDKDGNRIPMPVIVPLK